LYPHLVSRHVSSRLCEGYGADQKEALTLAVRKATRKKATGKKKSTRKTTTTTTTTTRKKTSARKKTTPARKKSTGARKKTTTTRKKSTVSRKKAGVPRQKAGTTRKKTTARKAGAKKTTARKYSKSSGESVRKEMDRYEKGTAKSGRGGKGGAVKSRKQAIAIGLSEARAAGKKVPPNPNR
jgi:hypothetical protein